MYSKKKCEVRPEDIFQCDMCGDCCRGFGGTYVTGDEIGIISKFLKMDPALFVKKYCQKNTTGIILAQKTDGYCVFWDKKCTIHPVKPHMCKAWPFIEAVIKDVSNWHMMANVCSGIRTDFPDHLIVSCVRKVIEDRKNKIMTISDK
ncbi:MAG: YkgJ family cysteine cluster protein [Desulfobacterales bacterium]